ncbi:hypothetical protein HELRODRAFT_180223 [Helobdella robusta]|uniref:peptide chain release factor N(5)-glutamine methyltransferase n=1 Tax=Helobdella robusta TaxID=6412 RepID=T1FFL2_HELRO|nr:hypothetical protein HELRODRAFT_180223 [Helobdella robusta]ESN94062.1 hypothetical protein HELRODRAFT_180223 [Helobdella robusta]
MKSWRSIAIKINNTSVLNCVSVLCEFFKNSNIGEPLESARYIVAHALNKKTINSCPSTEKLSRPQLEHVSKMVDLRLKQMPIQYIVGGWDFLGVELDLKPPVFIPRPETEMLIELISNRGITENSKKFFEVGCGSGAISLALLKKFKNLTCTAVDISHEACSLTRLNSLKLGLESRINVINRSFSDYIRNPSANEKFDFLVSNPPYIPTSQLSNLQDEIKNYEDVRALDGGEKGFDVIEQILSLAPNIIKNDSSVWLEVDESHFDIINDYTTDKNNLKLIAFEKDFLQKYFTFLVVTGYI